MLKIDVKDQKLRAKVQKIHRKAVAPRQLLLRIWRDQQAESGLMFRHLKRGGRYRGVEWPEYAIQYRRKTDGVEVPAWGGVSRLDGQGNVLGRLRPSGRRITPQSNLLRDTGQLATTAASVHRFVLSGQGIEIETPTEYGRYLNEDRPFMFFAQSDGRKYNRWAARELME